MEYKEQELARLRDAMEQAKSLFETIKAEHDLAVLRRQDLAARGETQRRV
jgi:hypothetical protein